MEWAVEGRGDTSCPQCCSGHRMSGGGRTNWWCGSYRENGEFTQSDGCRENRIGGPRRSGYSENGPTGRESRRSQRSRIIGQSKECPYLNDAITRWTAGKCTFEETLIEAAMAMSKTIHEMQQRLIGVTGERWSHPGDNGGEEESMSRRDLEKIGKAWSTCKRSTNGYGILGIRAVREIDEALTEHGLLEFFEDQPSCKSVECYEALQKRLDDLLVIRPMDTAPMDGSLVVLWFNSDRVGFPDEFPVCAFWERNNQRWNLQNYFFEILNINNVLGWTPVPKPIRKEQD